MDQLKIRNLEVTARQGNPGNGQITEQKFLLSAALYLDMRQAGKLDDPALSLDAAAVMRYMTVFMQKYPFRLQETAAERMAEGILTCFQQTEKVVLEIEKVWTNSEIAAESVSVQVDAMA